MTFCVHAWNHFNGAMHSTSYPNTYLNVFDRLFSKRCRGAREEESNRLDAWNRDDKCSGGNDDKCKYMYMCLCMYGMYNWGHQAFFSLDLDSTLLIFSPHPMTLYWGRHGGQKKLLGIIWNTFLFENLWDITTTFWLEPKKRSSSELLEIHFCSIW